MLKDFFQKKILPAVNLPDDESALAIAEAFLEGGLDVMEVTFRTSTAASSIYAIKREFPSMKIGAGTILSPEQIIAAKDEGAQFGLAPGYQKSVVQEAKNQDFPFIPGISTPSEIERALNHDFRLLKIFPVADIGGPDYIKSLEGPYQHTGVNFLPMGGVNQSNLQSYLSCSSVTAIGGSWLAPRELVRNKDFNKITSIVRRSLDKAQKVAS